jgi:hypothetical protein
MIHSNVNIIYEKDNLIKSMPIAINNYKQSRTVSVKQNNIDPIKSSPPNNFMIKLHKRMYNYKIIISDEK